MPKSVLDKDLKKVMRLETATHELSRSLAAPGLATLFLVCVFVFTAVLADAGDNQVFVILASVVGAYMALNIGANDVANNMGPAVGGRALKMSTALVIAAVCEMAGAMIAGGEVVETISKGIISPGPGVDVETFMFAMLSALIAAAGWIHLATFMNAPVSTTHSIVGGVLGAGLAAAGPSIVSWSTLSTIAANWVISPLLGGAVAALLLGFIKWAVLFRQDRLAAAQRCVPLLIAMMAGVFGAYLLMKGLNRVWHFDPEVVIALSIGCFVLGWLGARPWVRARLHNLDNQRKHISNLFVLPLIFATAFAT